MPLISVIVPVYNVEHYLHRCVDSILAQTFADFELILVDDGSPDNCPAICDEYARKDKRVVVIHQENGGLSAARNAGIDWVFANSNSEWLTFIDSDDWIHPKMLEFLHTAAIEAKTDISVCSYQEVQEDSQLEFDKKTLYQIYTPEDFYVKHRVNAIIAWGKLYRKRLFQDIRYPVGKIHEDEYVTYKILFANEYIAHICSPLYFYYINFDGITKSKWNIRKLDGLIAQENQLAFFRDNGFFAAEMSVLIAYIINLVENKKAIENLKYHHRYKINLSKNINKVFKKYRKQIPFKENIWLYQLAYPRKMRFYWFLVGVSNKIKSIIGV